MHYSLLLLQQHFDKPSSHIALDLIYASNQYKVRIEDIEFGLAQQLDQRPDIDDDPNTFVPVLINPTVDDRFQGGNGFMYWRIPIAQAAPENTLTVSPPQYPFHLREVLDQINGQLSTQFTLKDVLDLEYTEPGAVVLKAHPNSLAWVGTRPMQLIPTGVNLKLFPTEDLIGFEPYVGA